MWWDERLPCRERPPGGQQGLAATVDLDCPYLRSLVLAAFRRRPAWRVTVIAGQGEEPAPEAAASLLHWGEYERIAWDRVSAGAQAASSYAFRKGLIRKAQLAHNARKWAAKHPGGALAAGVPQTLVLQLDDVAYIDEALSDCFEVRDMADGSAVWVAKPSLANQAAGIALFDRVAALRALLEAQGERFREWVLQRYIERPLLVGGRKFHLRAYVLCVGRLRVYVYSEALALFARKPYQPCSPGVAPDLEAHLTNTCFSSGDAEGSPADRDALVRTLSELPEALEREGMSLDEATQRVQRARRDMYALIGECMEAVSRELTFQSLPNCFELFGFDLLLDEEWHLWLLEANAEPDFAQTGARLRPLVEGLVEATLRAVADPLAAAAGPQGLPEGPTGRESGAPAAGSTAEGRSACGGDCAAPAAGGEARRQVCGEWVEVYRLPGSPPGIQLGR